MKYFSCQPDSHNAFGSLTNGVLTYFTVDCARYKRLSRASGNTERAESGAAVAEGPRRTTVAHTSRNAAQSLASGGVASPPTSTAQASANAGFDGSEAYQEPHFCTDTRMHIQRTLTLPGAFQSTQCCFSMANRTVFGTDMAFIGAANGLLALVVLHEDLLLYVRGKDPQSLRDRWQRGQRGEAAPAATATSSYFPSSAAASLSGATASSTTAATTHLFTGAAAAPPSPMSSLGPACASSGASVGAASLSPAFSSTTASPSLPPNAGVPSTITWMRDKPLVLVGYSNGQVEWYRVSLSVARRQALMDPSKELPFGPSMASGAFAYQALNRDAHTSRVVQVVEGGHGDGLRTEMVAHCHLPDAGALLTSDYFPANGTVAVGGERGGLYLFHPDQLAAPLCQLHLRTPTAGFLYCHPFLPIVGVVSSVVWADATGAARRRRATQPQPPALASPTRVSSPASSTKEERTDRQGGKDGLERWRSSPLRRGDRRTGQENALMPPAAAAEAVKTERHVGWYDAGVDGAATLGRVSRASEAPTGFFRPSSFVDDEVVRSGCVFTLVEYTKKVPPRQLARSWAGDQPLSTTHRLSQVLQHWMEAATTRDGASYTFSWKFSFDLEVVVSNIEEGALRVVRISRATTSADSTTPSQSHRGRADGGPATDSIEGSVVIAGAENENGTDASYTTTSTADTATGSNGPHPDAYRVTQEYNVRLPLHSLVNVEYISAATSALSVWDTAAMGDSGNAEGSEQQRGSMTAFQREAERHRRHSALLAAAAQAVADPRSRLGSPVGAAGQLCRPADAFWAGLAVVSLAHQRRHLTATAEEEERRRYRIVGAGGRIRGAFDGAAGRCGGDGRLQVGGGSSGVRNGVGEVGGGLQLKENALAVAMLQPLRGEYGGVGRGRRHRNRHGADASSSSFHTGTDAASSSRLQSSSSTSTPQRRHRHDRDPLAPAITVPSYATRTTRNEIANAVLIAADHRVELHDRLRIGAGNVSCVVGMNAAGEVGSVPIEVRAVATWHEEGSIFVGLGPTTCAADLVSIQGIERLMRLRHAAGFGIAAVANLAAAKKVGGYGSEDVVLLFTYVATLERDGIAASTGSVLSLMELLRVSSTRSRGGPAVLLQSPPRLDPRRRAAMHDCSFHDDPRRLLALQVLGWLPPSVAEEWKVSAAATHAPEVPEWLQLPFEAAPVLSETHTNTDVERAAAIEASHSRYGKAADLLLRFAHRSPNYRAVATLLQRPAEALAMVRDSDERVCAAFRASLTPWLLVVFHCLCSAAGNAQRPPGAASTSRRAIKGTPSSPPSTALPRELYEHPAFLLWDRVALAIVMEDGASGGALAHVLRDVLLPQCNPVQALLLHHGVHRRTCPAMQEMVDCTGDFQLGACLFARVGVLTTAAALAFPFLLDGVVQSAAAAPTTAAGDSGADALAMIGSPRMPGGSGGGGHDVSVPDHPFREASQGWWGDADDVAGAEGEEEGDADGLQERRNTTALPHGSRISSSPYAYLYDGTSPQSSRRASPPLTSASAPRGALDGGVSHTACLVRNSALPPPPPPQNLLLLPASDASSPTYASSPHASPPPPPPKQRKRGDGGGVDARSRHRDPAGASSSNTELTKAVKANGLAGLYRGARGRVETDTEADDADIDSDACGDEEGELTDEPWVWWAAAYRSFLDDEQAFVRRTTFDVECQQLRIQAAVRLAALLPKEGSLGGGAGGRGGSGVASRIPSSPPHRSSSLGELDETGYRLLLSSDGGQLSLSRTRRTGGRLTQPNSSLGQAPLPFSLSSLCNSSVAGVAARGYGHLAGFSQAELVVGAHAATDSVASTDGTTGQDCVCGERHEGTQLIRSLMNLCNTTTTRCSVCLEPVRLGSCDVSSAFAWCTSCRHGGHAHHLQEWFRTHRRCPVDGCDCHCDEDSSLF
ncbi:hypothetical protein ABB37_05390 [Leptomonas pyrrhocoris]|uniref:GATOR2 complex protein MIO zinc-ribbon like domain-containing protein n=1 Tax=Leptomonas pyrrhocoris TaxID=157538 RepID=A0A0N0DUX9_LEPPY|nr:hypothetical protein ABB37_05390 [Leptomonas pyrrhocoris]KPA79584.1 hypothetical protein ABB37_05390 [Leptomonas pyrrhocoris]|eukprot:XP_015658023.1 hypothetical protein ABB37_05390 [Leptomonas pyrrhocoris]